MPRNRRVYPVLLIDAIVVKVRDSQVANRPVYVAIGVNLDGERDVLGLWLGPSGGEGAKQWMSMLTELRNRDPCDLAQRYRPDLRRAPRAQQPALRLQEVLGQDRQEPQGDLHRADRRGRRSTLRRVRSAVAATPPNDDPLLGERAGGVVPFLEFPVELRRIVYTTNAMSR